MAAAFADFSWGVATPVPVVTRDGFAAATIIVATGSILPDVAVGGVAIAGAAGKAGAGIVTTAAGICCDNNVAAKGAVAGAFAPEF
ncbi:hypothetical protein [Novosphingobium sp.]|uniref:hypothetical protein n=1 Tax=Novosphingobium sp. TaxID=1874826 RepID=UPI003B523DB4